jgi:hypothetical protein
MSHRMYALTLVLVFFLTATATTVLRSRSAKVQSPNQPQQTTDVSQSDVPIADFNAPEPAAPSERIKRGIKNRRHNLRERNLAPEDKARFILREDDNSSPRTITTNKKASPRQQAGLNSKKSDYIPPVIAGEVTDESAPEQSLPIAISDAVIIGEVKDAKAFLSEDKTAVYSEFIIQVDEVLKGSSSGPMTIGSYVTALRPGGGVRFPSGKVRKFLVAGRTLPHRQGRYALFLKYDDLAQAFYIVTGYELRGGKVFPLDGIPKYGSDKHPFASYSKYLNADETTFLADLREAIIHPPPPSPSGYPIVPSGREGGSQGDGVIDRSDADFSQL